MANQNEVTRLCPNCRRKLYRSDELRGRCKCGQHLVSLSGRWGAWDNDTTESIEALGDPGQWVEVFADPGGQYLGAVLADPARLPFKRFAGTFWYHV
jgi:hypothetical protein